MTDLKTIILAYIRNGVHVTRSEGRIWLMGDGTIEAAGKVAKL